MSPAARRRLKAGRGTKHEDDMAEKIKIDGHLYDRLKKVTEIAGYTSVDDFVTHMIEKELTKIESADSDSDVEERLRGLGYIE
ncbi:MAG: hypothetical protein EDS66_07495 [Planctomycetota bacterium]|nr:MAG: hypothetical protein EDS66_07495 [Planctomycetota bacterium]MCQ3919763.1 hypothetical protein [Planctomycetota bacterium]